MAKKTPSIQPLPTHLFGGYPYSQEQFNGATPDQAYGMLRFNLKHSMESRSDQMQFLAGTMHRRTEKRLQKMLRQGWRIIGSDREPFLRRVQYTLVRPMVTIEEARFLGWTK